jgi:hypothetical protein
LYRSKNKYSRLLRDRYYKSGRKAIASHSIHGWNNVNGLSSHLQNELSMDPEDRKNSRLPCGYTLAQSWDALRKCWKGFYISKSKDNSDGMSEYASRIRKLQQEIGIPVTQFNADILNEQDQDILDEDDVNQNESQNSCPYVSSKERKENQTPYKVVKIRRRIINSCTYQRRRLVTPNNEKMMDRSLEASSKDIAFPTPREGLFSKPVSKGEKSCQYIRPKKDRYEPRRETEPWTTDDEKYRWHVNPGDITIQPHSVEPGSPVDDDENCYYKSPEHEMQSEDEEDRKRKRSSCTYKRGSIDY